jgi:hypothetical protein
MFKTKLDGSNNNTMLGLPRSWLDDEMSLGAFIVTSPPDLGTLPVASPNTAPNTGN